MIDLRDLHASMIHPMDLLLEQWELYYAKMSEYYARKASSRYFDDAYEEMVAQDVGETIAESEGEAGLFPRIPFIHTQYPPTDAERAHLIKLRDGARALYLDFTAVRATMLPQWKDLLMRHRDDATDAAYAAAYRAFLTGWPQPVGQKFKIIYNEVLGGMPSFSDIPAQAKMEMMRASARNHRNGTRQCAHRGCRRRIRRGRKCWQHKL
jgi:hypothetical protein